MFSKSILAVCLALVTATFCTADNNKEQERLENAGVATQRKGATDAIETGSTTMRALAVGAFACGAAAIGAIAVGAVAIGRLRILEARIEKLSIGTLTVDRLRVRSR
jgi:hypothetical protein